MRPYLGVLPRVLRARNRAFSAPRKNVEVMAEAMEEVAEDAKKKKKKDKKKKRKAEELADGGTSI